MKKITITIAVIITIASVIRLNADTVGAAGTMGPSFLKASSTVFTLTTSSQRLLATTSPQGQINARVSATIQPINCTAGTAGVFMSLDGDLAATANSGLIAFASSTTILGDHVNQIPVVRGPVNGITAAGTCTVLVTEWRTGN